MRPRLYGCLQWTRPESCEQARYDGRYLQPLLERWCQTSAKRRIVIGDVEVCIVQINGSAEEMQAGVMADMHSREDWPALRPNASSLQPIAAPG